jgi:thiamine-phosphate pyrophosphorylase
MINCKLNNYIFIKELNENNKKNIIKLINKNIIYKHDQTDVSEKNLADIQKFCLKSKTKLYIVDDYKLALKIKAQGVYVSSKNKRIIPNFFTNKKYHIIGSVHNQLEYYFKSKQRCKTIALSPIFYNPKYSLNKILGPLKFNLISQNWNESLICLGGINNKNFKRLKITKAESVGFLRLIEEKPAR